MTRQEAIDKIIGAWWQRDSEFCVGHEEEQESQDELFEALEALGVTAQELADAGYADISGQKD